MLLLRRIAGFIRTELENPRVKFIFPDELSNSGILLWLYDLFKRFYSFVERYIVFKNEPEGLFTVQSFIFKPNW